METEIQHRDYTIKIIQDDHPDSPDDWGDDGGFLVYDHRDFYVQRKGFDPEEIFREPWSKGKLTFNGYFVFGVDAYIHSGVVLALRGSARAANFPDKRWDVSFRGFVLVKREKGRYTVKSAQQVAEWIIEEWNMYLSGDVWGFKVIDNNGEEIDSCWGFYGQKGCIDEAKRVVNYRVKRRGEQLKIELI